MDIDEDRAKKRNGRRVFLGWVLAIIISESITLLCKRAYVITSLAAHAGKREEENKGTSTHTPRQSLYINIPTIR